MRNFIHQIILFNWNSYDYELIWGTTVLRITLNHIISPYKKFDHQSCARNKFKKNIFLLRMNLKIMTGFCITHVQDFSREEGDVCEKYSALELLYDL